MGLSSWTSSNWKCGFSAEMEQGEEDNNKVIKLVIKLTNTFLHSLNGVIDRVYCKNLCVNSFSYEHYFLHYKLTNHEKRAIFMILVI